MKIIIKNFIIILLCCSDVLLLGCRCLQTISMESGPCGIRASSVFPEYIFFNWYTVDKYTCEADIIFLANHFGFRHGYFKEGKQSGLWQSHRTCYIDSLGVKVKNIYIFRTEYFKDGLRDSVFTIYNKDGNIVYETLFKKGTGIEKDYHDNGQLYYEIATKDGYFIDTLRLYDDKGRLIEKLFYEKDSLVYHEKMDENGFSIFLVK